MIVPDVIRRTRLQALMARQLANWQEAWQAYASGAPVSTLQFRNGTVLRSGPRDAAGFLFFEVFANGCYRRGLPANLSGTVIDIGANIGAFTLDVAIRFPGVIVHAYEPDAEAFSWLRENVRANGLSDRVHMWNEAVAGAPGSLTLWRGDGSIAASAYLAGTEKGVGHEVAAVTLPVVMNRCHGRVAVLKMDCEGAEADILEADGVDMDSIDCIVAEYHAELVPDVIPRMRRVLEKSFDVVVAEAGRCGPMLRAVRR
jgi:FkbM family methyltransferase